MADDRNEGGNYTSREQGHINQGGTPGTGAAPATATATGTLKVARDGDGVVKLGTWETVPPAYEVLSNRDEIIEALMNFNAHELREKIADLCLNKF